MLQKLQCCGVPQTLGQCFVSRYSRWVLLTSTRRSDQNDETRNKDYWLDWHQIFCCLMWHHKCRQCLTMYGMESTILREGAYSWLVPSPCRKCLLAQDAHCWIFCWEAYQFQFGLNVCVSKSVQIFFQRRDGHSSGLLWVLYPAEKNIPNVVKMSNIVVTCLDVSNTGTSLTSAASPGWARLHHWECCRRCNNNKIVDTG